jgi:hypothetical protein
MRLRARGLSVLHLAIPTGSILFLPQLVDEHVFTTELETLMRIVCDRSIEARFAALA